MIENMLMVSEQTKRRDRFIEFHKKRLTGGSRKFVSAGVDPSIGLVNPLKKQKQIEAEGLTMNENGI